MKYVTEALPTPAALAAVTRPVHVEQARIILLTMELIHPDRSQPLTPAMEDRIHDAVKSVIIGGSEWAETLASLAVGFAADRRAPSLEEVLEEISFQVWLRLLAQDWARRPNLD